MQLVLQPCSSPDALKHFFDTIQNPVETSRILPYLEEGDREAFERTFPKAVAVWGVTPGKPNGGTKSTDSRGGNQKKWERMALGDTALFYRNKNFFLRGTIAYKKRLPELARELWKTAEDEQAWEFVYFISDLEPVQINIHDYNQAAGYSSKNIVQGYTVHTEADSLVIADALGLESNTGSLLTSASDVSNALAAFNGLEGELDVSSTAKRRKEQSLLRTILLKNKATECCALCGRDLPVDLLVIGHIRKRHSCTSEMKKDLANVMPVCLLGCDRLFENGYVVVNAKGAIQAGLPGKIVPSIQPAIQLLVDKQCSAWSETADGYFEWHRTHHHRFA